MIQLTVQYVLEHRRQLLKFIIVGLITFGINFASFHLCYGVLAFGYKLAVSLAYVAAVVAHFLLHRIFTFRASDQALHDHTWRYLLMLALNYAISLSVVWATVELAKVSPYFGVIAST